MGNEYSKLYFDISKADEWVKFWSESKFGTNFQLTTEIKTKRKSYILLADGKEIKLDFIEASGGKYTVSYKLGNNQDLSKELADYIVACINNSVPANTNMNGFSILTRREVFDDIVDLLNSDDSIEKFENKEFHEVGKAQYSQFRFWSKLGDHITIKYFETSKRLQIQGKPGYLFCMMQDILLKDDDTVEGIVDANIKFYSVNVDSEDIYEDMKEKLGIDLYEYLTKSLRALLSSAFVFYRMEINLDSYGALCVPALVSLEGYIFKLMISCGIIHNNEMLNTYFGYDKDEKKYLLDDVYVDQIDNEEKTKSINILYNIFHRYRNKCSHATERDFDTKVINERETADSIFREVINAMKTSYELWK